jgi:hypothetical protein
VLAGYHGGVMASKHSRRAIQQLLSSMDMGFLELLPLAGYEAKAIASLRKDGPQEILAYSSANLVSSWVGENFDFKI